MPEFGRVSCAVSTDHDYVGPDVRAVTAPERYEPALSRIVLHETVHFWQHLSSGYLLRVAAEDWRRLQEFERTGRYQPAGPRLRAFGAAPAGAGFSVLDLHEALARYWDVHICNPRGLLALEREAGLYTAPAFWEEYDRLDAAERLRSPDGDGYTETSFELAMRGVGGRYAQPFLAVTDRLGRGIGGLVFPIAAHFALQTEAPVEALIPAADLLARLARHFAPGAVEDYWPVLFQLAATRLAGALHALGIAPLTGPHVMAAELLAHPVYGLLLARLLDGAARAPRLPGAADLAARLRLPPGAGHVLVDGLLAMPGIPAVRLDLLRLFPPLAVRFTDDRHWVLGALLDDVGRQPAAVQALEAAASLSLSLHARWSQMRAARYA